MDDARLRPVLYIVVPCYNEEEVLRVTPGRFYDLVNRLVTEGEISPKSRVVFVDDGSSDKTWTTICKLNSDCDYFTGIKLAHNAGHQRALLAGMSLAAKYCDCCVTIDADLQDDPRAIRGFLEHYRAGDEIVYGVRSKRNRDTRFKRVTAHGFYRFMNRMGVDLVYDHADYRLLSKRALEALLLFEESNVFLRGMVPSLGFKSGKVFYARGDRVAGESKYPLKKMLSFAMDGITSFTDKPLKWIAGVGAACVLFGILMLLYIFISTLAGRSVAGWASVMVSVWVLGGFQLVSLGIIGIYVGKVYMETKRRPRFIIEDVLGFSEDELTDDVPDTADVVDTTSEEAAAEGFDDTTVLVENNKNTDGKEISK